MPGTNTRECEMLDGASQSEVFIHADGANGATKKKDSFRIRV